MRVFAAERYKGIQGIQTAVQTAVTMYGNEHMNNKLNKPTFRDYAGLRERVVQGGASTAVVT